MNQDAEIILEKLNEIKKAKDELQKQQDYAEMFAKEALKRQQMNSRQNTS